MPWTEDPSEKRGDEEPSPWKSDDAEEDDPSAFFERLTPPLYVSAHDTIREMEDPVIALVEFESRLGLAANEAYDLAMGESPPTCSYLPDESPEVREILQSLGQSACGSTSKAAFRQIVQRTAALAFRLLLLHEQGYSLPSEVVCNTAHPSGQWLVEIVKERTILHAFFSKCPR